MKKLVMATSLLLLCACGSGPDAAPSSPTAQDSGVAWCKRLADPSDDPQGMPSGEQLDEVREAWEGSRHANLRTAGLAHLAALQEFYEGGDNLAEVAVRKQLLVDTCGQYGVEVPDVMPPSLPAFGGWRTPVEEPPLPTPPGS